MFARINSLGVYALNGFSVSVEADISGGLPQFTIVGLPDSAVREATDRVRSALKNLSFVWPVSRITVNLAPGDIRKTGPVYDLPVLLAILAASGQLPVPGPEDAFIGELSLDGARAQCDGRAAHGAGRGAAGRAPPVRSRRKRGRGRGSRRALRLPCPYGAGRSAPFDGRSAHRTGAARAAFAPGGPRRRTGLCRCPGPAGGPARHGDRRRRRPQYFIDRRAGHGKIHAGQTSAGHSAAALPHGGCGDDRRYILWRARCPAAAGL